MYKNEYLKSLITCVITTLFLTGCPANAPSNSGNISSTGIQGQGIIKGIVYKSGIKASAEGDKGPVADGSKIIARSSIDTAETTAKADGSFELPVKQGAEYTVEASFADDKGSLMKYTTTVKVPAVKDPQVIDIGSLVTRRTGSIQGVLTLEDAQDAEGADVFIAGTSSIGKVHKTGRFALTGVDEGKWKVVFQKSGYENTSKDVDVKSGRPSLITDKIILKKADAKAGIKGKVINNQGQPIPGVAITAYIQDMETVAKIRPDALSSYITTTDIDGNYELLNLPATDEGIKYSIQYYRPFYELSEPVEISLSKTDTPKNMDDMTMASNVAYFGQIKGKVVDIKGEPVDAAVVQTDPQVTDQKFTDANGNFTLDRVMAGEYQLSIAAGGNCEVIMPLALINEQNKTISIEKPVVLSESKTEGCISVLDPVGYPSAPPTVAPNPTKAPPDIDVKTAGFLGWYIFDDLKYYETISNTSLPISSYGDPNLYYYEPSGGKGLMDSSIAPNDAFAKIESHILNNVGDKIKTDSIFNYNANSNVSSFKAATYTYALAYLYIPKGDTSKYTLGVGNVDDGISILVNSNKIGYLKLGNQGEFDLNKNIDGKTGILKSGKNVVIVILVDNSRNKKYIRNVSFSKDGNVLSLPDELASYLPKN